MKRFMKNSFFLGFLLLTLTVIGQVKPSFQVVPLGVKGGIDEKNLSAYLVAPVNTNDFVCLAAGTINGGIEKAIENNVFKVSAEKVLKSYK
jgi:3',5'-cyclic-nucleotide phosphodiesterase